VLLSFSKKKEDLSLIRAESRPTVKQEEGLRVENEEYTGGVRVHHVRFRIKRDLQLLSKHLEKTESPTGSNTRGRYGRS